MKTHYVVAEYRNLPEAKIGLEVLHKIGLGPGNVSLIARSEDPELSQMMHDSAVARKDEATDESTGEGAAKGAGMGAAMGAALGFPFAMASMIAPFFIVGPLATAVAGAVGGGSIGGAVSTDDERIQGYRQRVIEGSILVVVTGDEYAAIEAEQGLKTTHFANVDSFEIETAA